MSTGSTTPLVPLKFIAEIVSGGTPKADSDNWNGDIPFITPPDLNGLDGDVVSRWERTLTDNGASGSSITNDAVLLSCRAPIGHVGVVTSEVAFNQGCKSIVPQDADDLAYVAYCLVASRRALQALGRGTTFMELSTTELSNFSIPWPVFEDRCAIVRYLDRETAEIDAMLATLEELTETLRLRRVQAIQSSVRSSRSVGIGLMLDVKLGKMLQTKSKTPTDRLQPYLRAAHIQPGGRLDLTIDTKEMYFSEPEAEALSLRAGDAVIVEGGAGFGRAAYLTEDMPGWGFQNSIIRLRGASSDTRYAVYALQAALDSGEIAIACNAATFAHFTAEKVEGFRIPYHGADEHQRIADHLDEVTGRIDAMLATIDQLKALLVERRAALITDVVTGRKKVPA
ncbi:restriction endonuclease subunit S [Actinomyces sp.]